MSRVDLYMMRPFREDARGYENVDGWQGLCSRRMLGLVLA